MAWVRGPAAKLETSMGVFLVYPDGGRWRALRPGMLTGVAFEEQAAAMAFLEDYYNARARSRSEWPSAHP